MVNRSRFTWAEHIARKIELKNRPRFFIFLPLQFTINILRLNQWQTTAAVDMGALHK